MVRHRRPWLAVLVLVLSAVPSFAQKVTAGRESAGGLQVVRFATPSGSLHVYLPDDLAAGDTLSGTVYALPEGRTDAEREARSRELFGYRVEVGGEAVTPGNGSRWLRHLPGTRQPLVVRLRTAAGRGAEVPVDVAPPAMAPPESFSAPTFGQAGHAVAVAGPFSGDLSATSATMNGAEVQVLAQSPRQTVLRVPPDAAGPSVLRLDTAGTRIEAPFRVLGVNLSADKLDLRRGERTRLRIEVRGLEGLDEPVPLTVTNSTPQVVQLASGESERVTIRPADVGPGGVWALVLPVQSRRTGDFVIDATVGPAPRRTMVPVKTPAAGAEEGAGEEPPPACACREIAVTVDSTKVKAQRDAAKKKVTVTVPFSAVMTCLGEKGKCEGSVSLAAVAQNWLARKGGKREAPGALPAPPAVARLDGAAAGASSLALAGSCPKDQGKGAGTAAVEIDLDKEIQDFEGPVTLSFQPSCGAEAPAKEVTVYVDSKATNLVNLLFSDLDGDGRKDYRGTAPAKPSGGVTEEPAGCACASASGTLTAQGAKANAKDEGSLIFVTVTLPYTGTITCAKGKSGKCQGELAVTAGDFKVEKDNTLLEGTLAASSIPCSGVCGRATPLAPGSLTFQAFVRGARPVKGSLELTLSPGAPCQGTPATFAVNVDTSKSGAGQVVVKPKK